jgi:hypothetical protein
MSRIMLLKSKFQTTGRMIFLVTFICFCLLTITEINGHCKADNKFILFEKILTREVLLGNDVEKYPLSLDVYEENSVMRYIFEYKFEKKFRFSIIFVPFPWRKPAG